MLNSDIDTFGVCLLRRLNFAVIKKGDQHIILRTVNHIFYLFHHAHTEVINLPMVIPRVLLPQLKDNIPKYLCSLKICGPLNCSVFKRSPTASFTEVYGFLIHEPQRLFT